ncbi:MAG: YgiT-type zinc finger protein [Planctomycetota bacterium]|nr:YgiT-type zinc finger protein [Planctomycetota bacterium]
MLCAFCEGRTVRRKVTAPHWLRGKLYIVKNVEAEVCRECGERYYHAKTLDAIDAKLLRKHAVKERLQVEVVAL